MKRIKLLFGALFLSTFMAYGQSVTITPNETTAEGTDAEVEIKKLKTNSFVGAQLTGYRSRELSGNDAAVTNGQDLLTIASKGFTGLSGFQTGGQMTFEAAENWTGAAIGTDFRLRLGRVNSGLFDTEVFTIKSSGDVGLGSLNPGAKLDIPNGSTNDDYPSIRLLHTSNGFNRLKFETLGKDGNFVIASKIETNPADSRLHLYSKDAPVGNVISLTGDGKIIHEGYTRLGSSASDAPLIKMKKITGTTASTEGASVNIPHELGATKILAVDIQVNYSGTAYVGNSHLRFAGYQFDYIHDNTNIRVYNVSGNSANILSKPVTILITYEE